MSLGILNFLGFLRTAYIRSSPLEVFLWKGVLKICSKFTVEHPCQSMISIKLQSNFTEIRLQHGCSSVNLLYVFRTLLLRKPLVGCFCYMQYMNLCFQPQWDLRCSKSLTQRWKGVLNNNNFTKISGKLYKRILQNTVLWFYLKLLIPGGNKKVTHT